ncbi:TetR/AcrR family transcriptional regulator [uncultured Shimia sp.]|uniref:TetR/AcrR family transcriptional regulator n=1 Tax=uncultured Shimia sp. TaxID=573152 RepID=UPI002606943D|nr:TetR/AcrR family transcriptional regulator [uncultured Shimia sp.]
MSAPAQKPKSDRYEEILEAAAECFQKQGFSATSIDTVARHLGSTKGRVYHYFPSKMDLFNAVRDRAMEIAFDGIRPGYDTDADPIERLRLMSMGHARVMMLRHSYMQVLLDGLQMQRYGATTEFQRQAMARHLAERNAFETMFREVLTLGADQGVMTIGHMSITLQSYLITLNGPVFWYRPRSDGSADNVDAIAHDIVRYAMRGLGIDDNDNTSTISTGA